MDPVSVKDVIFFEKQEGRLCAQHALNMLLQGSYFSADVLAEIANQLDDEEKRVLSEQARANFKSQNLDDSGFFSIQVITAALHRSWDLLLVPIQSPSMAEYAQNPGNANAYICNLAEHWFVLRKFYKQWYILNSVLEGPKEITDSYLELYLKQLESEGYAIFVVYGILPASIADEVAQEAYTLTESMKDATSPQPSAPSISDINEDDDLNMAIALSLAEANNAQIKSEQTSNNPNQPSTSRQSEQQPMSEVELLRQRREKFLRGLE